MDNINFDKKNALNSELMGLMSSLSANTSNVGDWKIIKIYESRLKGEEDPYDFDELSVQRRQIRERINEIQTELSLLD